MISKGLLRTLDANGIVPAGITLREPSLDDVFQIATGRRLEGAETEPSNQAAG